MSAYLALLDENLDGALVALHNVDESHPAAELARRNRDLLEGRRTRARNDRTHPSNPYLELGLPHRSPVWKQRYRDLRREFADDREEAARLNRAMRRIQQAEQHEDWSDFFVLPLDAEAFRLPDDPPTTLVPPVEPLPRRTAPTAPTTWRPYGAAPWPNSSRPLSTRPGARTTSTGPHSEQAPELAEAGRHA